MHVQNSKTFCWALILKCPPQSCWCCTFGPHGMLAAHLPSTGKILRSSSASYFFRTTAPCPGAIRKKSGSDSPAPDPGDATEWQHNIRLSLLKPAGGITHCAVCWLVWVHKNPPIFIRNYHLRWTLQSPGVHLCGQKTSGSKTGLNEKELILCIYIRAGR